MYECFAPVKFSGESKGRRWWNGRLLGQAGRTIALVRNGVVDFTLAEDFWPKRNLRELDEHDSISFNWQNEWKHVQDNQSRAELCHIALNTGGPILELAAGPGGGNLSPLLHLDPGVSIMVNDLESRVLHRWQQFISGEMPTAHVLFAAFDAVAMPLRDDSVACMSSAGGLGNIRGDIQQLLRECRRVLRPQGKIVAYELAVSPSTVKQLPEELHSLWRVNPWLVDSWLESFADAGLSISRNEVCRSYRLEPQHSGLATDATAYGIEVIAEMRCLVAEKV